VQHCKYNYDFGRTLKSPANSLECLKLCDENSGVDGEVDGGVDGGNDGGADGGVEVKSQFSFYVDYLLKMRSYDQR